MNGETSEFFCDLNDYYDAIYDRIVDSYFLAEIGNCTLMLALNSMVLKQEAARMQSKVLDVDANDSGMYVVTYELFSGREDVTEITSNFSDGFLLSSETYPTPNVQMGYFLGEDPDEYEWDLGERGSKSHGKNIHVPILV